MTFRASAAVIASCAVLLRLLHVWQMRGTIFLTALMGDARGYDSWAQQLAAGDWVGREVFYQAPLYPYFLGLVYATFGHDLLTVRIVQAVLGATSCVALGYAAHRLISPRAGLIAGLMLACYPPAIFFDGLIQKSVLDVLFVTLALAVVADITEAGATRLRWATLGLTMGALALTRENALILIAVIALWALTPTKGTNDAKDTKTQWGTKTGRGEAPGAEVTPRRRFVPFVSFVSFVMGVAMALLPVAARNSAVGGGFYLTTSQFGSNLYIGNHPGADGSYVSLREGRGSPEFERVDAMELAEQASGRRLTPAEVSRYWTRRTLSYIAEQPGDWLALLTRKTRLLVSSTELVDTESQESHAEYSWPLAVLGRVWHFGVLLPLAAIGAVALWHRRKQLWPLYALTAAYAASVILFFVVARYRLPLVPMLVIFAAGGLLAIAAVAGFSASGGRPRVPATAWAIALALAIASNWPLYSAASQQVITENNLGTALQEAGRPNEAIARYQRALALKPDYVPAMNNLGTALRAAGRVDEAVAVYDRALATTADRASVFVNRGNALMAAGRLEDAVASFRQAVVVAPDSAHARTALANALYDLGTAAIEAGAFDRAAVALREAIAITPDYAEAHNNLGIALASVGKLKEAMAEWEEALRIRPDFEDARRNLARAR